MFLKKKWKQDDRFFSKRDNIYGVVQEDGTARVVSLDEGASDWTTLERIPRDAREAVGKKWTPYLSAYLSDCLELRSLARMLV